MYLADIISLASDKREFFVIGGEQMYNLFGRLCNRIHLTEIFTPMQAREGDAIFNFQADGRQWKTLHEEEVPAGPHDDFPSRYSILDRKFKTVRYVELEEFYTESADRKTWISGQIETINTTIAQGDLPHQPRQLQMFEEREEV